MELRFAYNFTKALQVLSYFVEHLGAVDKVKLMKLVYLADRAHFLKTGVPITGDRLVAMPHGPVPSSTLSALNGDLWVQPEEREEIFKYVHVDDHSVLFRRSAGTDQLSADERATLDEVLALHGAKATWPLVQETHQLPEYKECYVEGTSRAIPYERIAKFGGNDDRFRLGRAVLTTATASQLPCPFPPDADL